MVVHIGLCCDVFGGLVISVEIVVRFAIAIEHKDVSNKFCRCVSSRECNVFSCRRGLDHNAFGVSTPVDECALHPDH